MHVRIITRDCGGELREAARLDVPSTRLTDVSEMELALAGLRAPEEAR